MTSSHIYHEIARGRQMELAGAATRSHRARRTSSVRAPFAARLLGRSASA